MALEGDRAGAARRTAAAAHQAGLMQVTLTAAAGQTAAKHLYSSLCFRTYGREPRALKVGEVYVDEDLMMLDLQNAAGGHPPTAASVEDEVFGP